MPVSSLNVNIPGAYSGDKETMEWYISDILKGSITDLGPFKDGRLVSITVPPEKLPALQANHGSMIRDQDSGCAWLWLLNWDSAPAKAA